MLRIGEFSKLSHLTVKALRFYEKEGLLIPENVDEENVISMESGTKILWMNG